jgi:MATE family multidrug resistance protein
MLEFAIPGLVMIESEYLSFEILTVMASYFGIESLAAQSIISNIGSLTYQLPFAFGCAISTRVAIYIGGGSMRSSKVAVKLSYYAALLIGLITLTILVVFRRPLCLLFTSDERVLELAMKSMPILAFNQICDTFNIISAGILRSQGRQKIGSYLNVFAYYVIALPLAFILAFNFKLEISGLWLGLGTGIFVLAFSETFLVAKSNWVEIIEASEARNHEEPEILIDDDSTIASSASSFVGYYSTT